MTRSTIATTLATFLMALAGCGSADTADPSLDSDEGAVAAKKYDLKAYAMVNGYVAIKEDAVKLRDAIKESGGKIIDGSVLAGATGADLGLTGSDAEQRFGIECMRDEYVGDVCTVNALVKVSGQEEQGPKKIKALLTGKLADAVKAGLPGTSPAGRAGASTAGFGAVSCTWGSGRPVDGSATTCTLPVVSVVPGLPVMFTLDSVVSGGGDGADEAELRKGAKTLIDAFF